MRSPIRSIATVSFAALGAAAFGQLQAVELVSGLSSLTGSFGDPTNASRVYAVQKTGQVIPVTNGIAGAPVFDVSSQIATDGERGLLGLAFDPNYAANGRVYLSYVNNATKALDVVRTDNFNLATAEAIISVPHPTDTNNHYGGNLRFGTDGNLYIGMGDGGGGNDPENDAQNLDSYLGKILRIDVSGSGPGYATPGDNPFVGKDGLDEIWAYGLRNPFKFSFDTNGDLYIGDVGQDNWEEIDRAVGHPGGVNYGWRAREGFHQNPAYPGETVLNAADPIFEYDHGIGQSITGGVVYRGSALGAAYVGRYFFGDFVNKRLWSIDPNASDVAGSLQEYTAGLGASISFTGIEADANGELLLTSYGGSIYQVQAVPEPASMLVLGGALAMVARRRRRP